MKHRCIICDTEDQWENVDVHRHTKKGMCICNVCGFVHYPDLFKSEEEIKAHYRTEYRPAPQVGNYYTGARKLNYHAKHLGPLFEKWKADKKENPKVFEVGAAFGMVLDWVKYAYPGAEVDGTELTQSFKNVAYHQYGLMLKDDFDTSKKYDLIISYKVAEHMWDIDKRMREYAECLTDDGYLYISVPTWFNKMTNFGKQGFDLEYYYDTNHINVWTQKLFETLLKKCGLQICSFDDETYDQTYICKRNDDLMNEPREYEDSHQIKLTMNNIKKSSLFMDQRCIEDAIKVYPNYPDAWTARFEANRARIHQHNQQVNVEELLKEFVEPMMEATNKCYEAYKLGADICFRYEAWQAALTYLDKCNSMRPGSASVLIPMSHCFRNLANRARGDERSKLIMKAMDLCALAAQTDPQHRADLQTWIFHDQAKLTPMVEKV